MHLVASVRPSVGAGLCRVQQRAIRLITSLIMQIIMRMRSIGVLMFVLST